MKKLLLVLLALASLAKAGPDIYTNGNRLTVANLNGCFGDLSTPTWALNVVSPTVSSSVVDVSSAQGVFLSVSGPTNVAGNAVTRVYFSSVSYAAFVSDFDLVGYGSACVPRSGRYMKIQNASTLVGISITATYQLGASVLNQITATASGSSKFTLLATTATAQYVTITAATYVLFSNPGSVDIVGDWSATASTPANLSNTGSVRILAGGQLAQSVKNGGIVIGYPWFIYANMNPTSPPAQCNF